MAERLAAGLCALVLCVLVACPVQADDRKAGKTRASKDAQAWAFGVSESRKDALWRQSVNAQAMRNRATPTQKPKAGTSMDTTKGIESALSGRQTKKNDMNLSWEKEKTGWNSAPNANRTPSEQLPLQSDHHLRAHANVVDDDNLNVRLGPEMIVKDSRETPFTNRDKSDQPDSSLGVGMQFQLGF